MNRDTLLKVLIVGGALGVAGWYVYKTGLWARWFGGVETFSDQNALLAYCRANPSGQATFVDAAGASHTAPCSQWIASNPAATPAATPAAPPPSTTTPTLAAALTDQADIELANKLRAAALVNGALGSDRANIDQWNYLMRHDIPGNGETTPVLIMETLGISRDGVRDVMDAATYVSLRKKSLGMSGFPAAAGNPDAEVPYGWVV